VYLIGEFQEKDAVREAIRLLREGGVTPAQLDIFSEEPVEYPRGVLDRPSRMSLASVLGAIAFGSLATAFIYWTQHNYPVITGGMPTFSFWATGVITFEMTMLGAIVSTFVWFLLESGLGRKRSKAPVPQVDPGSICLRVRCEAADSSRATDAMRRAGAVEVERREDV
jgi:Alternative complex III, ActD subunit